MTDQEFCTGWKQVRVFTPEPFDEGALKLYAALVGPFFDAFPATPFFITRYLCTDAMDSNDTDIGALPAAYRFATVINGNQDSVHHSIRLRYRCSGPETAHLVAQIHRPPLWYSAILDYTPETDIGGDRFCAIADPQFRLRRARLVGELLHAHARVLLDYIRGEVAPIFGQPPSPNNMNTWHHSGLAAALHLIRNAALLE